MQLFVGFACGLLCLVALFAGVVWGLIAGAQVAVDQTARKGFFRVLNKRYRAVEITDDDAQEAR